LADEGGVSFWLLGTYGSLAAVPSGPVWSSAIFNYYASVDAQKGVEFVRGGGIQDKEVATREIHMAKLRDVEANRGFLFVCHFFIRKPDPDFGPEV
jgi:hypothetical protein